MGGEQSNQNGFNVRFCNLAESNGGFPASRREPTTSLAPLRHSAATDLQNGIAELLAAVDQGEVAVFTAACLVRLPADP